MKKSQIKGNPFENGATARQKGQSKSTNPYGTASREWARWNCGWDAKPATAVKTVQEATHGHAATH